MPEEVVRPTQHKEEVSPHKSNQQSVSFPRERSTALLEHSEVRIAQPQASHPLAAHVPTEDTCDSGGTPQSVPSSALNILASACATICASPTPPSKRTATPVGCTSTEAGDDDNISSRSLSCIKSDKPPPSQPSVTSPSPRPAQTRLSPSPEPTSQAPTTLPMADKPSLPTVSVSPPSADTPHSPATLPRPVSTSDAPPKQRSARAHSSATAQSDLRAPRHKLHNFRIRAAPPAPADPQARILAERPWTLREAYLLVFVTTHCPTVGPEREYWPAVCDLYNYMLMFPQLHAWASRTEAEAGLDRENSTRRRHAFWAAFWKELCAHWRGPYDVGPQATKLQHVADAFLAMCVGKADEVERAGTPTAALWNVAGGAGEEAVAAGGGDQHKDKGQMLRSMSGFTPGADGWYDVAFPPLPHVYDSMHTQPWAGVWDELIHSPMGADFRMRRSTVEAFGRVYELLGPRYPRRTPWECWHRWAVPITKVSKGEDYTIEHLPNKSIVVRAVGDQWVAAHQREGESPSTKSQSIDAGSAPSVLRNTYSGPGARKALNDERAESGCDVVGDGYRDTSGEKGNEHGVGPKAASVGPTRNTQAE